MGEKATPQYNGQRTYENISSDDERCLTKAVLGAESTGKIAGARLSSTLDLQHHRCFVNVFHLLTLYLQPVSTSTVQTFPNIFTGRNEVVAKVMFLQVCVCPQGGRVSASVHAGMPDPPGTRQTPQTRQTPRDQADPPGTRQTPPQDQADPPGTKQILPGPGRPPRDQADPPGTRQTPPDQADPSGKQTPAYGLQVAGTHPTGMHSFCFKFLEHVSPFCRASDTPVLDFW